MLLDESRAKRAREAGLLPPLNLWIDALCINQADNDEKASQVAMMGRIYAATTSVTVWLGPEDVFTRPALDLIFRMFSISQDQTRAAALLGGFGHTAKALGLPEESSTQWWALYAFLQRSWFRRAWITQEVALAPKISVEVGLLSLPWIVLPKAAAVLYESRLGDMMEYFAWFEMTGPKFDEPLFLDDMTPIMQTSERTDDDRHLFPTSKQRAASFHNIIRLQSARDGDGSRLGTFTGYRLGTRRTDIIDSIPILHMFDSTRRAEATDPRDRIYACLSLSQRDTHDKETVSPLRRTILPNYNHSTEKVYIEAAWYTLLSGNDLELLMRSYVDTNEDQVDDGKGNALPSWVPDWRQPLTEAPLWSLQTYKDSKWSASKDLVWVPPEDSTVVYGKTLSVNGVFVDTIIDVVESDNFSLSKCGAVATELPEEYPWADGSLLRSEVLWRTLIANSEDEYYPARDFGQAFYYMWMDEMKTASREYHSTDGLNDPEKEKEWYRFVHTTGKLFPHGGELNEKWKAKEELKGMPLREHYEVSVNRSNQDDFADNLSRIQAELGWQKMKSTTPTAMSQVDLMLTRFRDNFKIDTGYDFEGSNEAKSEHDAPEPSEEIEFPPKETKTSHEFSRLQSFSKTRRIFRTKNGYLGNGPRFARRGDQVWALAGSKVPFILRPHDNEAFLLVGDAYVHGLMHGEAFENNDSDITKIDLV
ncbi:hypothetical protein N8I77_002662 [Diaporthe amygdali]|uniref:Heterokaryon incompatibility domain-containing protein n=1 Tax=Phomopsis amygdali TaxID=1214568 RepID=A0AAD9STG1_PHOAM|nr:hypothetical protein N8I77_002662 [Diaporthe amygdali]